MTTNAELCETLETQLVEMDRSINIRTPTKYFKNPTEFHQEQVNQMPPGFIMWGLEIEWPAEEIAVCKRTGFNIYTTPHNSMWIKFKNDFPYRYQSYRTIVRNGLYRTGTEFDEKKQTVKVIYYVFIAKTSLRGNDRDEVVL